MYGYVIKTYSLNGFDFNIGYTWDMRLSVPDLVQFRIAYKGQDVTEKVRRKERQLIQNKIYTVLLRNRREIKIECAQAFEVTSH